ncbi:sigma 54-interacting transcriptional regulator [Candidatus Nitrospira bockiana]
MMQSEILILQQEPVSCPGGCREAQSLLARWLDGWQVRVVSGEHLSGAEATPQIIWFRIADPAGVPELLAAVRGRWPGVPVIAVLCGTHTISDELKGCLVNKIDDYLCCPFTELDALPRLHRLLQRMGPEVVSVTGDSRTAAFCHYGLLIGNHPEFLSAVRKIPLLAVSDAAVLLKGETGTGKELFARAIHYASTRAPYPFVPVNCSALPDHLFENELFGHAKGAYTDASSPENGLVAEAEGGTLFLDEIDTLSATAQAKVLRFVQDHEYRPLGSAKSLRANVRILAATNTDMVQRVARQQFRQDLYYRLNILNLTIPPLRERPSDLPILTTYFLERYSSLAGREPVRLSADALHKLMSYEWPGNVRELEGVIQRAVTLNPDAVLTAEAIDLPLSAQAARMAADESLHQAKVLMVEQFERAYLSNLLTTHMGNITRAAKAAGKPRQSLQRLLRKHQLSREAFLPR